MHNRLIHKGSKKVGLPPGTLMHVGQVKAESVLITVMEYDAEKLTERQADTSEAWPALINPSAAVTWINIDGLHDVGVIEKIGERFGLHPLILEDILQTGQRPKFDDLEKYLFAVLGMLTFDETSRKLESEQVSIVLCGNVVITFQENVGDVLGPLREHLRQSKGRIRKSSADYLFYSIIDSIIDHYFVVLEKVSEQIEILEEQAVDAPFKATLKQIHRLKREMLILRKAVWPVRELVAGMQKSESVLITKDTRNYLHDIYDHIIQIIDTMETLREITAGLLEVYLSSINNRMNAVMKVLTIITTIFMPLTFLAGLYGMNFEFMPELHQRWGYPVVLGVMVLVVLIMLLFFKKKRWL